MTAVESETVAAASLPLANDPDADVTFYWGTTSGSGQKALRKLEEPNVMLPHITHNNRRWDGVESLFADSGGYSVFADHGYTDYPDSLSAYLDWVDEQDAAAFATRDYPCERAARDATGGSVADHQRWTTQNALACLDAADARGLTASPVPVVQGWAVSDYLDHVDALADHGILSAVDTIGIGSVCRRGEADRIRRIIAAVTDAIPSGLGVHAFGVKRDILRDAATRDRLTSVDSCAWFHRDFHAADFQPHLPAWLNFAECYLEYRAALDPIRYGRHVDTNQQTLDTFDTTDQ